MEGRPFIGSNASFDSQVGIVHCRVYVIGLTQDIVKFKIWTRISPISRIFFGLFVKIREIRVDSLYKVIKCVSPVITV